MAARTTADSCAITRSCSPAHCGACARPKGDSVRALLRRGLNYLAATGPMFRLFTRQNLFVFLYHDVTDDPSQFSRSANLYVTKAAFATQLRLIADMFEIISPTAISVPRSRPGALITFDDGMASYFETAVPIMAELRVPSLIFLNLEPIEDGTPFWSAIVTYLFETDPRFRELAVGAADKLAPREAFLACTPALVDDYLQSCDSSDITERISAFFGRFANRAHLREMERYRELVFFGNHLSNHYNAATLTPDGLRRTYLENARRLAAYPNAVPFFSYPFGQPGSTFNRATHEIIFACGAQLIFSAYPLPNREPAAKLLHRTSMVDEIRTPKHLRARAMVPALLNEWVRRRHVGFC